MEPLSDPLGDRYMKDMIPPPHKPIDEELLYDNKQNKTTPNWEVLKSHLYKEGRVSKEHC